MRDSMEAIFRWATVLMCVLVASACTAIQPAIDSLRWTTPLDAKKETLTITNAVADTRKTGSDEHKAILEKDPKALKEAGDKATEREENRRKDLGERIKKLEDAQLGAIAAIGGVFPGAGETLAAALGKGFQTNQASSASAQTAAAGAAKDAAQASASTKQVDGKVSELEKVVDKIDPDTIAALRKLDLAALEKIAKTGNRDELVAAIRSELAQQGLPPERIEKLLAETKGMSSAEIMALIGTALGGGLLGTGGGRVLSGSGKRIDANKKEIDELYDEVAKLREKNVQLDGKIK